MDTKIAFFPVDNGDMTLLKLGDDAETTVLIDCNIREAADDPTQKTRDVASDLRSRLRRDGNGRPYVDAFLLSHPDEDHCRGLKRHFYLGPLANYPDDNKADSQKRIVIRELWSSPMVFRRASKEHVLCDDAVAWNAEARRRVQINRNSGFFVADGDRILVLGEDEDGKTDDLAPILVKVDQDFNRINGSFNPCLMGHLLAPMLKADDDTEDLLSKNHSSVIVNFDLKANPVSLVGRRFLSGGDAEVAIWERLWEKHEFAPSVLEYDLLQTPHHCSWHSLSYDSWSELHEDAVVSSDARSALSQIRDGGIIVASSCPIVDDDCDPPCYGAKLEYETIVAEASGAFYCTAEYPAKDSVAPLEFTVTATAIELKKTSPISTLLRPAAVASGLGFPNKPVVPNKPAGFA